MGVFRQFPYSNFHEMNMDEIIKIIKNMLEEWSTYHAEWDQWMADLEASWTEYQDDVNAQWAAYQNTMNTAWQSMQNFINNYFDNLDVQDEINNKIISMIHSGEFGLLINDYVPPAVNAWLNQNITQPVGVVIDTSLTVSGACADAKATGDAINNVKDELTLFEDGFHDLNLFRYSELLYENGYASIENGHISSIQTSDLMNAYILPVDGVSVYSFTMCRFAFLLDEDKYTAIGNLLEEVTQVDTTGASYVCFTINKTRYPLDTFQISKGTRLLTGFEPPQWAKNEINPISNDIYNLLYNQGVNLFDKAILLRENAYASIENGHIVYSTLQGYNAYLFPVMDKDIYHFTYCRFAFLVDSDQYTAIGNVLDDVTHVNCENASYICFSFNTNTYPVSNYYIVGTINSETKPLSNSVEGNLEPDGHLQLISARTNLRKGERIIFTSDISSFSSIRIGLSFSTSIETDTNQRNTFRIDTSNISYYERPESTPVVIPHGLTITNNIQIIWEMTPTATCKITIISDGESFEHTFTGFVKQAIGSAFVVSNGSYLNNAKLSWTCTDLDKNIWIFGDSYLAYSPARWTYYLHEYDYDKNMLLDGFPGEGRVNGEAAFENLLRFSTPKIAVWCIGMNDGSDSNSEPSSDWVTGKNNFLQICENNDVTPIFGTIPTVPSINNEMKNQWIRSSGYRYIDFAKAVGANSSGVWYSGMLSDDNIHPSEKGAKALFAQALVDLPEMMIDNFRH